MNMTNDAVGKHGLVLFHQVDGVGSGNVAGVHDYELVPVQVFRESDLADSAPSGWTPHRRAPQTAVRGKVVYVLFTTRKLGQPFHSLHANPLAAWELQE